MQSLTEPTSALQESGEAIEVPALRIPDHAVLELITVEAMLADSHAYREWEALWHEKEGLYWVCGPGDCDNPQSGFREVSFVFDNRARIASRMRQLLTMHRVAQMPASSLSRVVSNYRVADGPDPDVSSCWANFIVTEFRVGRLRHWAGRVLYRFRRTDGPLKLIEKRIILVDRAAPIDTFTFIL